MILETLTFRIQYLALPRILSRN